MKRDIASASKSDRMTEEVPDQHCSRLNRHRLIQKIKARKEVRKRITASKPGLNIIPPRTVAKKQLRNKKNINLKRKADGLQQIVSNKDRMENDEHTGPVREDFNEQLKADIHGDINFETIDETTEFSTTLPDANVDLLVEHEYLCNNLLISDDNKEHLNCIGMAVIVPLEYSRRLGVKTGELMEETKVKAHVIFRRTKFDSTEVMQVISSLLRLAKITDKPEPKLLQLPEESLILASLRTNCAERRKRFSSHPVNYASAEIETDHVHACVLLPHTVNSYFHREFKCALENAFRVDKMMEEEIVVLPLYQSKQIIPHIGSAEVMFSAIISNEKSCLTCSDRPLTEESVEDILRGSSFEPLSKLISEHCHLLHTPCYCKYCRYPSKQDKKEEFSRRIGYSPCMITDWTDTLFKSQDSFIDFLTNKRTQDPSFFSKKVTSCVNLWRKCLGTLIIKFGQDAADYFIEQIVDILSKELNTSKACRKTLLPIMGYVSDCYLLGVEKNSTYKITYILKAEGESGKTYLLKELQRVLLMPDDNYELFTQEISRVHSLEYTDIITIDEGFKPVTRANAKTLRGISSIRRVHPIYNFALLERNFKIYRRKSSSRAKTLLIFLASAEAPTELPSYAEYCEIFGSDKTFADYQLLLSQLSRRFRYGTVSQDFRAWGELFFKRENRDHSSSWWVKIKDRLNQEPIEQRLLLQEVLDHLEQEQSRTWFGEVLKNEGSMISSGEKMDVFSIVEDLFYSLVLFWSIQKACRIYRLQSSQQLINASNN